MLPPWTYKEFYDSIAEYMSKQGQHFLPSAVKVMYPNSTDDSGSSFSSVNDLKKAMEQLDQLAALTSKFSTPPDTGSLDPRQNPSLVANVLKNRADFAAKAHGGLIAEQVSNWYGSTRLVDLHDSNKLLVDAKGHQVSWADALPCGDPLAIKAYMKKNITDALGKYGVAGTANDYLADFDTRVAELKKKAEVDAEDVAFANSYRLKDPASNAWVEKALGKGPVKILYGGQFELTRKGRVVTSRAKNGIAVYKVANCPFQRVIMFSQSQPYTGGGKYGKNELYFVGAYMKKPF